MDFIPKKKHLEDEKKDFIKIMSFFVDNIDIQEDQLLGRPRANLRDILKSLLIMSYHCWSYRRSMSDIEKLKEEGLILSKPAVSTLNKYMQNQQFQDLLKTLIELCALSFVDVEDCVILDSTWFCNMIRLSASNIARIKNRNMKLPALSKTRKIHIIIGKNSKIILSAETSFGTVHDSHYFKPLLEKALKLGFRIKTLLADAGYNSKEHYALCENYGIKETFIDFRKNEVTGKDRSALRRNQLIIFRSHPEIWHETYDMRAIIETVFSSMKRKGKNYIRSRNADAQDSEMLLRVLWYNLTIIAKYYY
ncbi:MAG: transposase [Nanoarchaeota archaeon]